ncbi:MAG: hypothetical protein ACK47B_28735 [Armatimonadota bacterium]
MSTVTLVVTQAVVNHAQAGNLNQRQIAIRNPSPEVRAALSHASAGNRLQLSLGGYVDLVVGDPGAIWLSHQREKEDFELLYELLARRPNTGMEFTCEIVSRPQAG